MGRRHDEISAIQDRKEVARYKARECRDALTLRLPVVVSLGGTREARIVACETLLNDAAVKMTVHVFQNDVDVTPEGLNPWIVVNPPMLVDDPAGDVVLRSRDPIDGSETVRTLREDPVAVLEGIVARKLSAPRQAIGRVR
jgi:hypothetical protein